LPASYGVTASTAGRQILRTARIVRPGRDAPRRTPPEYIVSI